MIYDPHEKKASNARINPPRASSLQLPKQGERMKEVLSRGGLNELLSSAAVWNKLLTFISLR